MIKNRHTGLPAVGGGFSGGSKVCLWRGCLDFVWGHLKGKTDNTIFVGCKQKVYADFSLACPRASSFLSFTFHAHAVFYAHRSDGIANAMVSTKKVQGRSALDGSVCACTNTA